MYVSLLIILLSMNRRDLITQRKADRKGCLPFMACRYYVNGWLHSVQKRFP